MNSLTLLSLAMMALTCHAFHSYINPMMPQLPLTHPNMPETQQATDTSEEPQILTCLSTFTDNNGHVANRLSVTIETRASSSLDQFNSVMGMGMGGSIMGASPMGGYGGFGGFGGSGGFGGFPDMDDFYDDGKSGLKAKIEFVSHVAGGKGYVVFTERARVMDGCTSENFGDVLIKEEENNGLRRPLPGMSSMAAAVGYANRPMMTGMVGAYGAMPYGMGFGMKGPVGHMGLMGHMGLGHMGQMGPFMGQMEEDEKQDGVVAEISVVPGALTTAVVDELDFDELSELAGRGVMICSELSHDFDGRAICTEEFFSCCALAYDDKSTSLVTDNDD